ncbi:hypothetical protein FOMPIDRAFT_90587 [Fomitopsis schrenkii]|uniref:C2H2-type domain-containing protein n=1 Tax=Fomitopsis schrenkii TaxID=2126942 RepID=S8DTA2_FOMSC|nr:hypothetical protein FOMPIDRAFT_90587 [Fomitopsis schrenkii]
MSYPANDSQQGSSSPPNTGRALHRTHPSHGSSDHRSAAVPNAIASPLGTSDTYWTASGPVATPGSPMRPRFLPLPEMPMSPPTASYEFFAEPPPSSTPAPTAAQPPAAPSDSDDSDIVCWYGSPCAVPLRSPSVKGIRQHLTQFHTADVDMRDGHAGTRCQWWTPRGACGREVRCEVLPTHVAGVHVGCAGCVCARCGWTFARVDALVRHQVVCCP